MICAAVVSLFKEAARRFLVYFRAYKALANVKMENKSVLGKKSK